MSCEKTLLFSKSSKNRRNVNRGLLNII
jgi:hypothetical protein